MILCANELSQIVFHCKGNVTVAADGYANGNINNFDKIGQWNPNAGKMGYISADFNMDSQVNNADKNNYWIPNLDEGFTSQVPD